MERREALKSIAALSAAAFIPKQVLFAKAPQKYVHFVGLGAWGGNAAEYVRNKIPHTQCTLIRHYRGEKSSQSNFIHFESPKLNKYSDDLGQEAAIPSNVKALFQGEEKFVLFSAMNDFAGINLMENLFFWLKENKTDFHVIASLPFEFEHPAETFAIKSMKKLLGFREFTCFSPAKIKEKYGNLPVETAFEKHKEEFYVQFKRYCL